MAPSHPLRSLCLALAGAGLLVPALAQDAAAEPSAGAHRALGLDPSSAASAPALSVAEALGLGVEMRAQRHAAPAPPETTPQRHAARPHDETPVLPAAAIEGFDALALAPAPLLPAAPAAALPPLAPVPDAPLPAPDDLRDAPLLAETRMTFVPLLAAVPSLDDAPPDGDGEPAAGTDVAQADAPAAAAPAEAPVQAASQAAAIMGVTATLVDAPPATADEAPPLSEPLPGHVPATTHAVAESAALAFAALDDTRVLAGAEPVAPLEAVDSPQVERVLATLAEVARLRDELPMLQELPVVATPRLSAVDRVLADLAEVTERWQVAQEAWLDDQRPNTMGAGWQRVARAELDGTRGGFLAPNGLRISFGIERAVYINGNLVATTRLTVSELGAISGTGGALNGAAGVSALIQNGALGTVTGAIAPGSVATVVQNALNGQQIQNTTVINATVNSLDVVRSMNLQSTIRNAVSDSLRR